MSLLLLGILNSQAAGAGGAGAYDLLETEILTSAASSVTFTGLDTLAAGYQHLQIRAVSTRSLVSGSSFFGLMRLNGDTGANYATHRLSGDGTSVTSTSAVSDTRMLIFRAGATLGNWPSNVIDILDFANTSKNTTCRSMTGYAPGGVHLSSGAWFNTDAVTSIELSNASGAFQTGSRFSIYGVRG